MLERLRRNSGEPIRAPSGVGIGLRSGLAEELFAAPPPALSFVEVTPENYLGCGGRYAATLGRARERWPLVTHGLSLSLGGPDPLDVALLERLCAFVKEAGSPWHSDHLCLGRVGGVMLHDLLPVPFSRAAAAYVAERIVRAEDVLGVPLAVENITYYATAPGSEMDEGDFVAEVIRRSHGLLLLDVNNVYVNARNHGHDPRAMLAKMPLDRVVQIHVAGHDASDPELAVDTHAEPIADAVYDLLAWTLARTGPVPVLLERDDNLPPWSELCAEIERLDGIVRAASGDFGRERPPIAASRET